MSISKAPHWDRHHLQPLTTGHQKFDNLLPRQQVVQSILTAHPPLCREIAVLFATFVQRTLLMPVFSPEIRHIDTLSIGRISGENGETIAIVAMNEDSLSSE